MERCGQTKVIYLKVNRFFLNRTIKVTYIVIVIPKDVRRWFWAVFNDTS